MSSQIMPLVLFSGVLIISVLKQVHPDWARHRYLQQGKAILNSFVNDIFERIELLSLCTLAAPLYNLYFNLIYPVSSTIRHIVFVHVTSFSQSLKRSTDSTPTRVSPTRLWRHGHSQQLCQRYLRTYCILI